MGSVRLRGPRGSRESGGAALNPSPNRQSSPGGELLTIKELCERLKIARSTLHLWRQRGQGPVSIKLPNGEVRFRERDVEEWLEALRTQQSVRRTR